MHYFSKYIILTTTAKWLGISALHYTRGYIQTSSCAVSNRCAMSTEKAKCNPQETLTFPASPHSLWSPCPKQSHTSLDTKAKVKKKVQPSSVYRVFPGCPHLSRAEPHMLQKCSLLHDCDCLSQGQLLERGLSLSAHLPTLFFPSLAIVSPSFFFFHYISRH